MNATLRRAVTTAATLTVAATITLGAGSTAHAEDRADWCDAYRASNNPPAGWTAECADDLPGWGKDVAGYADSTNRDIKLRRGLDEQSTRHAMGHEYAHALDANDLTDEGRAWFAHQIGKDTWRDDADYRNSPNEVWADGLARCTGWHDQDWSYKRVDCDTILHALDLGKTSGDPSEIHRDAPDEDQAPQDTHEGESLDDGQPHDGEAADEGGEG